MSPYVRAIVVTFLIGAGAMLLPLIGGIIAYGRFGAEKDRRISEYENHLARERSIAQLESSMGPRRVEIPAIRELLSGDVQARVNAGMNNIVRTIAPDSIERTASNFKEEPTRISEAFGTKPLRLEMRFNALLEPFSIAALQWETTNPNLVLEELTVSPGLPNSGRSLGEHLVIALRYTVLREK